MPQNHVSIGIDWADEEHAFHLFADQKQDHGAFKQDPQAIEHTIQAWRKKFPNAKFLIAIEQSKGALINALIGYDDLTIYPINPAALANYREAFAHGGGKNDPNDAKLLGQFLQHYHAQLRALRRDEPITRELAALSEDRRRFVDQRTRCCNELKALLKRYYPAVFQLKAAKTYAQFIVKFLKKYPTLGKAQKAGANKLREFFYGVGTKRKAEERVQAILEAVPLTEDEVTLRIESRRVIALCELIHTLNTTVSRYDDQLEQLVRQHTDYAIVASLPNASTNTQSRMIAALGDDRSRYPNAHSVQCASGIAPITKQSGKQKVVCARWATTKFMKQTFHEYAGLSIKKSLWARAYYDMQIENGKSPQMAKRALAFKWIRIIRRCWEDRVPYDEERYIKRLIETGSPIAKLLAAN